MDNDLLQQKIVQRLTEARRDPIVYVDRFCYTFDPKTPPYHLPFRLYDYEKNLITEVKQAIEQGYDIFIEKCREMGATYTVLDLLLWFWWTIPGSNFLLGSRKEAFVDNTKGEAGELSNKEESLFGKLEYTLNHQLPVLWPKNFEMKKHMNYMSLLNPENGNVISGESANANFSRGGRQKAILMDEFSFWENDSASWGATADTTRCRIVLTTPGIRPSKAKRLRFGKDGETIKVITLPYNLDPRKDALWLAREKARRSSEDFAREIMINWETSVAGKVYEEISNAEVGLFPFNPLWPLYATWDFGLDGVAIQWWQPNMVNGKKRIVDSYTNHDKPIQFFFPLFDQPISSQFIYTTEDLQAIEAVKAFPKPTHFGDPDVSKRSLLTGTSTRQELEKVGIYVQTKPEANDFASRRDKTKVLLQSGVEVNDTVRNEYWLEAMKNARYPQRQENSQATSPITLPIHDWTSHHRTATEYFAVNYQAPISPQQVMDQFPDEKLFNDEGFY